MAPIPMRCCKCKVSLFRRMRARFDDNSYICSHCAVSEIKRQRAMLPHTADGELIKVGEWYYCLKSASVVEVQVIQIMFQTGYDYWWCKLTRRGHSPAYDLLSPAYDLYSTEDAWAAHRLEAKRARERA